MAFSPGDRVLAETESAERAPRRGVVEEVLRDDLRFGEKRHGRPLPSAAMSALSLMPVEVTLEVDKPHVEVIPPVAEDADGGRRRDGSARASAPL